ncbi:MAG: polyprenol monophosphomannose synthase [Rickettsiales bacterium TMED289]|nr:MAG: polyprenol monophosphomannose synthase [Rickettsiales bacterium TMED289]|tara:strand:+ start:430 stop:1140 length:711 start_codon:yes stop_codon:yes gene_type:complete
MRNIVILPTYNESKNIVKTIDLILEQKIDVDILVIDDNSPDNTAAIVEGLKNNKIFLLKRETKKGLGSAYVDGFKWCIKKNYDKIIQMDADLSHDPIEIVPMFGLLDKNDLVIGSRYEGGLRVINWPIQRLYISYFANLYAKVITGVPVKDLTAGFKAWKVETLKKIKYNECSSQGYCFQIETTFRAHQKGCKLVEHPIVFTDRTVGESKMSKAVMMEAVIKVWLFGFWRLLRLKR